MLRVTPWLLNSVYAAGLCFCLPWLLWSAWRYGKYREGLREKLLGQVPPRTSETPCLWIHAVSVGEVNLVATTVDEWRRRHPDWDLVISTTTQAGYQVACQKYRDLTVCYAPLDFSWAVGAAIRRLRPSLLVLAETEIWPNLILRAHQSGVRVAVINGRLGTRSF